MPNLNRQLILDKTNKGLDVIIRLFPKADNKGSGKFPAFKIRDERTPSAHVFDTGEEHVVIDFGGKTYSCFDLVMEEYKLDFRGAFEWIADEFNIGGKKSNFGADMSFELAEKGKEKGDHDLEFKTPTEKDLGVLGNFVTAKQLEKLGFKSVKTFQRVVRYRKDHKNKELAGKLVEITTTATDAYPIFAYEKDDWGKTYEPLKKDKSFRFSYVGNKPKKYLVNLNELEDEFDEKFYAEMARLKAEDEEDKKTEKQLKDEAEKNSKFQNVIIASGERDAINVNSLGYPVVWKNSETEPLAFENFKRLRKIAKNIVNIPDIDQTGRQKGIELALKFLDIKTLWLPKWLQENKYRGKPQKDFTDWIKSAHRMNKGRVDRKEAVKNQFQKLLGMAFPTKFWRKTKKGKYTVNSEALYRFYGYYGFAKIREEFDKEDFSFVQINENQIRRVTVDELQNFPTDYIRQNNLGATLLNDLHNTNRISEKKLSKIDAKELDTTRDGRHFQRMLLENEVWEITKDKIVKRKYPDLTNQVWENDILPHDPRLQKEKAFKIFTNDNGQLDIDILQQDNHFLNYMINTSRVHWEKIFVKPYKLKIKSIKKEDLSPAEKRKKIEQVKTEYRKDIEQHKFQLTDKRLTDKENAEHKRHLINKIFSVGYLLHTYKREDRPWIVFATDHKMNSIKESHGGSGKSILFAKAIPQILRSYVSVAANDPEVYNDKHMLGAVTPNTDYVIFDDMNQRFPTRKVYTNATGEFNVRAMYVGNKSIPFEDSPKMAFTSNYANKDLDPSTLRRILDVEFSSWYHQNNKDFFETRTVRDDFGKNLLTEFDDRENSNFVNLMAQCIQAYLSLDEKIEPPQEGIQFKKVRASMGDEMYEYVQSLPLNQEFERIETYKEYCDNTRYPLSKLNWKKAIENWAEVKGYEFQPEDHKWYQKSRKSLIYDSTEYFYIKTPKGEQSATEDPTPEESIFDDETEPPY